MSSQTTLNNQQCVACNSNSYYDPNTRLCNTCSNSITDCQECSYSSSVTCTKCSVASGKTLNGGICVSCQNNQYFNATDSTCTSCSGQLANCLQCQIDSVTSNLQCSDCDASYEV